MRKQSVKFQVLLFIILGIAFTQAAFKDRTYFGREYYPDRIRINCDFDKGSMGPLKQVSEGKFRGQTMHWIKKDKIGNQYYWFYFKISNAKDRKLTFELDNLTGIYRNNPIDQYTAYTQPVFSYANKNWQRITDVEYDEEKKSFTFQVHLTQDTAWIAYAHPFQYNYGNKFIDSIKSSPFLKINTIGESYEGRPIQILEITNYEKTDIAKKNVFITTLQHGGEDCGGFFTEGLINYLLYDKSLEADSIRNKFSFLVILMMNPDGVFHGITRYNLNMEDLGREWDDDISDTINLPVEPEVMSVKEWVKNFYQSGKKLDLFIDVHSQSQKWTGNVFWDEGGELEKLVTIAKHKWPLKHLISKGHFGGSASSYFYTQYQIPSSTLELTQSYTGEDYYLNVNDYRFYGKSLTMSINDFFK